MSDYSHLSDEELQEHIDAYAKLVAKNIRKEDNEEKLTNLMIEQQSREGIDLEDSTKTEPRKFKTTGKATKATARASVHSEPATETENQVKKYILYIVIASGIYLSGLVLGALIAQL